VTPVRMEVATTISPRNVVFSCEFAKNHLHPCQAKGCATSIRAGRKGAPPPSVPRTPVPHRHPFPPQVAPTATYPTFVARSDCTASAPNTMKR